MPVQDRTNEFRACVESIRNRSSLPQRGSEAKQRLLQGKDGDGKSEFTRMANAIAKDISSTGIKLGKLAQCAYLSLYSLVILLRIKQWQNEKLSLTTVLWKSVYALCPPAPTPRSRMLTATFVGTHLYH